MLIIKASCGFTKYLFTFVNTLYLQNFGFPNNLMDAAVAIKIYTLLHARNGFEEDSMRAKEPI